MTDEDEDIHAAETILDDLMDTFKEIDGYSRDWWTCEHDQLCVVVLLRAGEQINGGIGDTFVEAAVDAAETYRDGLAIAG